MKLTTDGLIIKEQQTGEDDRLVTILTRNYGVIRAFVNGAKRIKSRSQSSTQLFAYGNYSIYRGKDTYSVDEARPIEIFFDLRNNIENLALAQYFCELAGSLAPIEDEAEAFLKLILNALHMLSKNKRPPEQLKAIVELRILCLAGYMPDIEACSECGNSEPDIKYYFSSVEGRLFCQDCIKNHTGVLVDSSILAALRYICYVEDAKLFSFSMPDDKFDALEKLTEQYLIAQTQTRYKTLEFYKTMKG